MDASTVHFVANDESGEELFLLTRSTVYRSMPADFELRNGEHEDRDYRRWSDGVNLCGIAC